jgi:hypothetical protein
MGEHKRPVVQHRKDQFENNKADLRHKRYIWRSNEGAGTFKYPPSTYGALKTRREFKRVRQWVKQDGFRGAERRELMLNIMGIDE